MANEFVSVKEIRLKYPKVIQQYEQLLLQQATKSKMTEPVSIGKYLLSQGLGDFDSEQFWVLNFDNQLQLKSLTKLYSGSVNEALVRHAEVFRQAIIENCPRIIITHNHPTGNLTPSSDDIKTTKGIFKSGKILDIEVVDHFIVGNGSWYSMQEHGLMHE